MAVVCAQVNLASVEGVWWEERRGGAVVAVGLPREGRVLLRPRQHDQALLQVRPLNVCSLKLAPDYSSIVCEYDLSF